MRWLTPLCIAGATILGSLSASTPAHALSCVSGPPTCRATPGAKVCNLAASKQCNVDADCAPSGGTCIAGVLAIGGTVTANPNNIVTIELTASTNLSLAASVPPTAASGTFRVVPTTPGVDAQGTSRQPTPSARSARFRSRFAIGWPGRRATKTCARSPRDPR